MTLITGGAASGKSRYAIARAHGNVLFIATCEPRDDEMRAKIRRHQSERPAHWRTLEAWRDITIPPGFDAVILDCVTLLVAQCMLAGIEPKIPDADFIVTNEVGLGLVPDNPLGREFRETLGRVNQDLARRAREVVLMVSGIPVRIK